MKIFAFNKDSVKGASIEVPDDIEDELIGKQDTDLFTSFWILEEVANRFALPLPDVNPISFDLTLYREVSA
jgi:hypothetical protein